MLKQTLHFCFIILVASAIGCGSKSSTDNGSNGDGVSGNDVAVDVRADWIPDDVTADQSGGLDQLAGEDQLQQDTVGGEDQS
ncbi:MAG: hypothetical protein KC609_15980, partial [Myxococcales bacterium]|nr:hypothetical protein [Myxococcales bacterium]